MQTAVPPIFLFVACLAVLAVFLLVLGNVFNPKRSQRVKQMPYESGMDPFHDARRRFDVRFHLLAIAFLVFDVELLFLYPWAVAARPAPVEAAASATASAGSAAAPVPSAGIDAAVHEGLVQSRGLVFAGVAVFFLLLALGFVYDWRKGVFRWR
jgi:NADH-quinone oxidoreductase subunit A